MCTTDNENVGLSPMILHGDKEHHVRDFEIVATATLDDVSYLEHFSCDNAARSLGFDREVLIEYKNLPYERLRECHWEVTGGTEPRMHE